MMQRKPAPPPLRPPSPSPSPSHPPAPDSPTFSYASTNPLSTYTLPLPPPPRPAHTVLTKNDLEQSQQAYSDLLSTAKSYRIALSTLSTAASAFGSALECCARLKESRADSLGPLAGTTTSTTTSAAAGAVGGPPGGVASLSNSFTTKGVCTADLLLGASGLHHLVANHQQILSETVYRSFEVPLLHELDRWRRAIEDEDEAYRKEAAVRSREIRRLEREGQRLYHQPRRRDVAAFREHLVTLTGRLDGLTTLHAAHARALLRDCQETSERILDASCSLVRAEVDIFEGLARKGWTGGGLDELLEKGHDLFASDEDVPVGVVATVGMGGNGGPGLNLDGGGIGGAGAGAKLFSILPPKSILAPDSVSDSGRTIRKSEHGRADSLLVDSEDHYQSLVGAVDRERDGSGRAVGVDGLSSPGLGGDPEGLFNDFNQNQGLRPFSPQPIRRRATDVVINPEALLFGGEAEGETEAKGRVDNDDDERGESQDRDGNGGEKAEAEAAAEERDDASVLTAMELPAPQAPASEPETRPSIETDRDESDDGPEPPVADEPRLEARVADGYIDVSERAESPPTITDKGPAVDDR
ncbi:hypothetical protein GGS23DRAFT_592719 [Durotheca rogersii]|uniref:uncharacterized protein n=1 Tax=Durotheca rogersii TaxID=419775 RepID=UPI00221FFF08|nr:uncharacterized protein GGS23DRAFT_592719 [Durotheca rogersii]KAI5867403.1 hypothetical protein GGS23DRAFT_592719 [Durotheca rogersii]